MNLEGKRVLVVGLGKTGEALCLFLLSKKARVKISEKKKPEELGSALTFWEKKDVKMEVGKHTKKTFTEADLIVLSPGVPWLPELEAAKNAAGHACLHRKSRSTVRSTQQFGPRGRDQELQIVAKVNVGCRL